jgi:CYTH domain-containing protein
VETGVGVVVVSDVEFSFEVLAGTAFAEFEFLGDSVSLEQLTPISAAVNAAIVIKVFNFIDNISVYRGKFKSQSIINRQIMNKTSQTEYRRIFLLEGLPDPLNRASAHVQLFDNYIANTRLRFRAVRDPETRDWTHILQQRIALDHEAEGSLKTSEIYFSAEEYAQFEHLAGTEIRKNRYFHEFDGRMIAFDVYLGPLWGLNTALAEFQSPVEQRIFEPPPFAIFEITGDPFFLGENLVHKKFADVQAEVLRLGATVPPPMEMMDE